jgi:hypothetical protein
MANEKISNPNDFKVVQFHNSTDFDFTPNMGCMYDGRPISGAKGDSGIAAGESVTLPYHIAHRLAVNLAKAVLTKNAGADVAGVPTGVPMWSEDKLEALKNGFLTDLYSETKPRALTETDVLMAKVEELNKFVRENVPAKATEAAPSESSEGYKDKGEVIAELEKRNVPHDKRKNKAELEKLLA